MHWRGQAEDRVIELQAGTEKIWARVCLQRATCLPLHLDHGRTHAHVFQKAAFDAAPVVPPLEKQARPDPVHSHSSPAAIVVKLAGMFFKNPPSARPPLPRPSKNRCGPIPYTRTRAAP